MIRFLALALIFWLPLAADAQQLEKPDAKLKESDAFIARRCRPYNKNGNCVWAASQAVFWGGAGYESFAVARNEAVRLGWHGSGLNDVLRFCQKVGVEVRYTRSRDYQLLLDGIAQGSGCYIEIPGHALVLVGLDEQQARIINNYDNTFAEVETWTRSRFDSEWQGIACCPKLINWLKRPKPGPASPDAPTPGPRPLPINPSFPKEPDAKQPDKKPEPIPPPSLDLSALKAEIIAAVKIEIGKIPAGKDGSPGPAGPAGPPGKDADASAQIAALKLQIDELMLLVKNQKSAPIAIVAVPRTKP